MKRFEQFKKIFWESVGRYSDKKIVVGGYDLCGAYFCWLWNKIAQRPVDYIVDGSLSIYGVKIYRELFLQQREASRTAYVCIVPGDLSYAEMFKKYGYKTLVLEEYFGCENFGYYDWLEAKYGCDFIKTISRTDFDYDYSNATNSGASRQMGLVDTFDFVESITKRLLEDDVAPNVLDVGCGKGAAIEIMQQYDFAKVDGIEMSRKICKIAEKNMSKLGSSAEIINCSATEFSRYDEYDVLYLYDPFRGEVFADFMKKVNEAAERRKKRMIIVYANPYHKDEVVKGGVFSCIASVDTDFFHRDVLVFASNVRR